MSRRLDDAKRRLHTAADEYASTREPGPLEAAALELARAEASRLTRPRLTPRVLRGLRLMRARVAVDVENAQASKDGLRELESALTWLDAFLDAFAEAPNARPEKDDGDEVAPSSPPGPLARTVLKP